MPKWIPQLHDPHWLKDAYQSRTVRHIAQELHCAPSAVSQALHRHGLPVRTPGRPVGPHALHDADWLTDQYARYTTHQIAVQLGCSQKTVWEALQRHAIPLRGHGRRPTANTRYRLRLINGRMVKVHRHVMEQHLGRPLLTTEHVHHIDGNPSNNAVSNLVVLTKSAHHRLHANESKKHREAYMQQHDFLGFEHQCSRCGTSFKGGNRAKYCPACR